MGHVGRHDGAVHFPGFGPRRRKVDGLDRGPELGRELLERGLGVAVGLVPHRRAHEREARRQRRRLALQRAEIGGGERPGVGVGRILPRDHFEDECEVGNRTREGADMIELARQRQHAGARDEPMARLDREYAAEGGGPDDRSVGLGAERERHHAGGHRRRRSRRGAAGRARVVMRVARRAGMVIGELGGHRLADDDGAGRAQLGHHGGVVARPAATADRRAELGRIIRRVDDVLDRDRNAVQRSERVALRAALVERARLRERVLAVEMDERFDLAINRFNAVEAGARIILGRNGTAGDFRSSGGRGRSFASGRRR